MEYSRGAPERRDAGQQQSVGLCEEEHVEQCRLEVCDVGALSRKKNGM